MGRCCYNSSYFSKISRFHTISWIVEKQDVLNAFQKLKANSFLFPSKPMPDKCNLEYSFISNGFESVERTRKKMKKKEPEKFAIWCSCSNVLACGILLDSSMNFWHTFECHLNRKYFHFIHINDFLSFSPFLAIVETHFSILECVVYVRNRHQGLYACSLLSRRENSEDLFYESVKLNNCTSPFMAKLFSVKYSVFSVHWSWSHRVICAFPFIGNANRHNVVEFN